MADLGKAYLDIMLSYPQLRYVMAWGLVDKYSWLQEFMPRADGLPQRPAPYDDNSGRSRCARPWPIRVPRRAAFAPTMEFIMKTAHMLRSLFVLAAPGHLLSSAALAEDGYDLWLRYHPVEKAWLGKYRAAATVLVTAGTSPTIQAARDELVRGLERTAGPQGARRRHDPA